MDRYETTIHLLDVYVKGLKNEFDHYCKMANDKTISDNIRAMYTIEANEAYTRYSELNKVLVNILEATSSENEES